MHRVVAIRLDSSVYICMRAHAMVYMIYGYEYKLSNKVVQLREQELGYSNSEHIYVGEILIVILPLSHPNRSCLTFN